MKEKSWEVSEAYWRKIEPLVPVKQREQNRFFSREAGGGRKPVTARKIFEAIFYVLRTGIQWKAIPIETFGCGGSTVHRYFQEWTAAGFFEALWKAGLAEYDEAEGIAWEWQSADGAMMKAPLAQEAVGPNPTDRGKKRKQATSPGGRAWRPVIDRRDRSQRA